MTAEIALARHVKLAVAVIASAVVAATLAPPLARAAPRFCTQNFPVAPANARCVNYSYSDTFEGGYCYLNRSAYTPDGRAIPSSCAYYDNIPPGVGRPPNPQLVPPGAAPTSTPERPPQGFGDTSDKSAIGTGGTAHLAAVRMAPQDGYDRVIFEFTDRVPGYKIRYQPLPAHADPSGKEIALPGASALLQITLTRATGNGGDPGGVKTYFGPATISAPTLKVTEVKAAGDFEAVMTWVVGLRSKVPYRVQVFDDPPSLIVDFQH